MQQSAAAVSHWICRAAYLLSADPYDVRRVCRQCKRAGIQLVLRSTHAVTGMNSRVSAGLLLHAVGLSGAGMLAAGRGC